jgi:hypothetical protein
MGFLLLLVAAAIIIPTFFEDEVGQAVKYQANKSLNATVEYTNVDLSIFRYFPRVGITLNDFSLVGKGVFELDTLIRAREITLAANLWSVISGDEIAVERIYLDEPNIYALVLEDGKANFDDIVIPDSAQVDTLPPDSAKPLKLRLETYSLENATIVYDDRQGGLFARLKGLTHRGTGNFSDTQIEMRTRTQIDTLRLVQGGVAYANNVRLEADVDFLFDTQQQRITLRDNRIRLNDFQLHTDGSLAMLPTGTDFDLRFSTLETSFRNILSLVPGVYTEGFENLQTDGTLAFQGFLKGAMTETNFPQFDFQLKIENGYLQYPDLPESVTGLNLDLQVQNTTNVLDNTVIDLRQLVAQVGSNPLQARFRMAGLTRMEFDAKLLAKLDLETLMSIFPMEGLVLKGKLDVNATAAGALSDSTLPAIDGTFALKYGYVRSADFPAAIDKLTVDATAKCTTGRWQDTRLEVPMFHTEIDNQPLDGSLSLTNLDDPAWKLALRGKLDLAKLARILSLTDMELAGLLDMSISTEGQLSRIEQAAYDALPTTGSMAIRDFKYRSTDFPQGLTLASSEVGFTPNTIKISNTRGTVGRSDISLLGTFEGYVQYIFKNQPLHGRLELTSNLLDLNEFLVEEGQPAPAPTDTAPVAMQVVQLPTNIDFAFTSRIGKVLYSTYVLENFNGKVTLANGVLTLQDTRFRTLGGGFLLAGTYDPRNQAHPGVALTFGVDSLDLQKTYRAFDLMRRWAPIAQYAQGVFSTSLSLNGQLDHHMNPRLETFSGAGRAASSRVTVSNFPPLQKLSQSTRLNALEAVRSQAFDIAYQITNGTIAFNEFPLEQNGYKLAVRGSNRLNGEIDYTVKVDAPRGAAGEAAANAVQQLLGGRNLPVNVPNRLRFTVGLGGTARQPVIKFVQPDWTDASPDSGSSGLSGNIRDAATNALDNAQDQARAEAERLRREAEERARRTADSLRQAATAATAAEAERLRRQADSLQRAAQQRAQQEAERLRQEEERRRQQLQQEADRRRREADSIRRAMQNNLFPRRP